MYTVPLFKGFEVFFKMNKNFYFFVQNFIFKIHCTERVTSKQELTKKVNSKVKSKSKAEKLYKYIKMYSINGIFVSSTLFKIEKSNPGKEKSPSQHIGLLHTHYGHES